VVGLALAMTIAIQRTPCQCTMLSIPACKKRFAIFHAFRGARSILERSNCLESQQFCVFCKKKLTSAIFHAVRGARSILERSNCLGSQQFCVFCKKKLVKFVSKSRRNLILLKTFGDSVPDFESQLLAGRNRTSRFEVKQD
jgi:hypothetical protein